MIILSSGQSNAVGKGTYGKSPLYADSRVLVWNNANQVNDVGDSFISPPDFSNDPWDPLGGNNLFVWFADRAAKELNTDVKLMTVAQSALGISYWDPTGSANMYTRIVANHSAAGIDPADVFLWHQGESDGTAYDNTPPADYKTAFLAVIAAMKTDGVLAADAVVIVGELRMASAAGINAALQELASENEFIYFASAGGLNTYDGVHYEGASLYDFGYNRYWGEYRSHLGFPRKRGALLSPI